MFWAGETAFVEPSTRLVSNKPTLRAGGQALTLLTAPLNIEILRCLEQGPRHPHDLRADLDLPPASTMRLYLRQLGGVGAIARQGLGEAPASPAYEISPA